VAMLEHFFDGAPLETAGHTAHVQSAIAVASCTAPYTDPGQAVVQFFVYNEFDQRFSTSRAFSGQFVKRLALIDTDDPTRSIFSVGVAGTLTGQTLLQGIGSGLHVIGMDTHVDLAAPMQTRTDAFNVHGGGHHVDGDVVAFRPPPCTGDCNLD